MKNNQQLLAVAIASLLSLPALATNGTNMIGISSDSVALGGAGVAADLGPNNAHINPGMVGKAQGTVVSFGGTVFKPTVSNNGFGTNGSTNDATSSSDIYVIPSVALTSRINENWTFGLGMYGTSGMGVDYKNKTASGNLMSAQSMLQIMRITPTIAFNQNNFGIGFAPILQYGALDINYSAAAMGGGNVGSGMASDLGMGYTIGGYYDVNKDFTLGASYVSAIDMKYDGQLSGASAPFVNPAAGMPSAFGDTLAQPAEIKVGAAYTFGNYLVTGDVKRVQWSDAKGYTDFGWDDQTVLALGLKYSGKGYWVGVGYNKADNPIKTQSANMATGGTYPGAVTNMFNNMFFPATTEQHFTFGGGYELTKSTSLDLAVAYTPEIKTTVDTSAITQGMAMAGGADMATAMGATSSNTTNHSQVSYTMSVKYKF
jgi:long-chain fatty acid transport protein